MGDFDGTRRLITCNNVQQRGPFVYRSNFVSNLTRQMNEYRKVACLLAYSASCALLHGLLQHHYISSCRSSWLSLFTADLGPYCGFVRKSLSVLQWSPLVAAGTWISPDLLLG